MKCDIYILLYVYAQYVTIFISETQASRYLTVIKYTRVVTETLPVVVLGRVWAVHLGYEMANERLLIESGVVGAQEVESCAK